MTMIPVLIDGEMTERDESELDKRTGGHEDENEIVSWVEYRLKGTDTLVHRSAHVHMKKNPFSELAAAAIG
ncbi:MULTISPECIES: hypothetical protein [Burkholderia]|uniref:hypothetical protein n=1 Tax=Burkholderia TaxID=32008 RepID=UPI000BF84D1D|nr:hypothetical protein [Burkholderia sp. JKS000303]PFH12836.1 hypothetical protein BX604_7256 [Burkholderia sp. JKS000303]